LPCYGIPGRLRDFTAFLQNSLQETAEQLHAAEESHASGSWHACPLLKDSLGFFFDVSIPVNMPLSIRESYQMS